jgi:DNA-binding CsgD family transcriptional regulator
MEFQPAIAAIERARDIASLSAVLFEWRDQTDLAHIVYHATYVPTCDRPNPVLLFACDDIWMKRYIERDYVQTDPVVLAGRKGFLPIDWMTVGHGTPAASHFFAEARKHGVGRHGLTFPIRGASGERALFSISSNATDHHWHEWRPTYLRDFHLVAHYFHDRAMRLAGLRLDPGGRPLSRRERESLQLLARGRTPQQIADDLNVSASAIHLYLRSGREKLRCTTTEQAIAKVMALEGIEYVDFN